MPVDQPHNHPLFRVGRDRLARAIRLLLARNDLSHKELADFAAWAAVDDEQSTWLNKSQISTLRNSRLPKPGPQLFMALGTLNQALARLGQGQPVKPLPQQLRKLAAEPGPWFLAHPATGAPCDAGDWFRIYAGLLAHPDLDDLPEVFTAEDASVASERLSLLAQRWMLERRLLLADARREIEAISPRLWRVVIGEHRLSTSELADERDALRFLVAKLQSSEALTVRDLDRWLRQS